MNQRPGKKHQAAALDNSAAIDVRKILKFLDDAQRDLEKLGEDQAAFRFEMFATFIREDYLNGRSNFEYKSKHLGL